NNVFMKKVNLSWNGFGREGCAALKDAFRTNSVLEEIDLTNNRITTEGAVLIGKGLLTNETLKVFKVGKNPIQSSGCWGIAAAILRNPNCMLKTLDFTDIPINKDFMDLWRHVEEQFPNIKMVHGGIGDAFKKNQDVQMRAKIMDFIMQHKSTLSDLFHQYDQEKTMAMAKERFQKEIE
ncbi:unnamed protein product, partial [Candidula unifasciata]